MIHSKFNAVTTAKTNKEKPKFTTTPKRVEKKVVETKKSRTKREEQTKE